MGTTSIEWTDASWQVTTGCKEVSPGCTQCYARTMANRLRAMALTDIAAGRDPGKKRRYIDAVDDNGRWTGSVQPNEDALAEPLRWKKPRMVFVNSMSDLFHKDVPFEFIDKVFGVMAKAYWHTFQVLTKRPDRMAEYLSHTRGKRNVLTRIIEAAQEFPWPTWQYADVNAGGGWNDWPYRQIWLGTSVENQAAADERWEPMNALGEAGWTTFVSYEPALGPVDWAGWSELKWLISGGESGPHARPSHPDWHRAARDYCQCQGIAYFFKQWGGANKKAAGRLLDGREWSEFPSREHEQKV